MIEYTDFEKLRGLIIEDIVFGKYDSNDAVFFKTSGGNFVMAHIQDCCESVYLEEIHGDPEALRGAYVTVAEEVGGDEAETEDFDDNYYESFTWTFYKICTPKEDVTFRWLGTSNGYYSESVDFFKFNGTIPKPKEWPR